MVKDDKESLRKILEKLISIRSETGNENALADFLKNYLVEIGFKIEREHVDSRYNLIAYREGIEIFDSNPHRYRTILGIQKSQLSNIKKR